MLLHVLHVLWWVRVMSSSSSLSSSSLSLSPPQPSSSRPVEASGFALWIDEAQVRTLNGIPMEIYAILDGHVLPYILDPNFEKYLPVIPADVAHINFTWKSGRQKYHYNFDQLRSFNQALLDNPSVSIATRGIVPHRAAVFTVFLSCSGNDAGVATFGLGLMLRTPRGRALQGMPLRIRLQKQCSQIGVCQDGCRNGGSCLNAVCVCPRGFYGPRCQFSWCSKPCKNGGRCVGVNRCKCPSGYHGNQCHVKNPRHHPHQQELHQQQALCLHHQCTRCRMVQDEDGQLRKSCYPRLHPMGSSSHRHRKSWT